MMRLSADDPGAAGVIAYLNGAKLVDCVEADSAEGWADVIDWEADKLFWGIDFPLKRLYGEITWHLVGEEPLS